MCWEQSHWLIWFKYKNIILIFLKSFLLFYFSSCPFPVSVLSIHCKPCCSTCSERKKRLYIQDPETCQCTCKHSEADCKQKQLELNERTCRWGSGCVKRVNVLCCCISLSWIHLFFNPVLSYLCFRCDKPRRWRVISLYVLFFSWIKA